MNENLGVPTSRDKAELYDTYAEFYRRRTESFTRFLGLDYNLFLQVLPGIRILDLGCGPGRDALVFKQGGFSPVCIDISEEMLRACRRKGLSTIRMNIEKLALPKESFDGIWSYTSLTTLPKSEVWRAIQKLHTVLIKNGILFLGLIEGEYEGWKEPDEKYVFRRYISRYQTSEVIERLKEDFELIYFRKISKKETGRNTYLNFMFRKLG